MSKIQTKQITLVSPNGLVEKTIDMDDSGVVKVNGVQVADTKAIMFKGTNKFGQAFTSGNTSRMVLTEEYDTNNCFSNSVFIPNVAGYYLINATVQVQTGATRVHGIIMKNDTYLNLFADLWNVPNAWTGSGSSIVYMNGTTDYISLSVYVFGATYNIYGELSGMWIGN